MCEDAHPTILVVEDDERVREFISTTLADADYNVLEAKGGLDGISAMLRYDGEIAMAVVEIKMPGINGLDLANQISIERPSTEVLYISDLDKSVAVESIAKEKPESMLARPFTAGQLLSRVRLLAAAGRLSKDDVVFQRAACSSKAVKLLPGGTAKG